MRTDGRKTYSNNLDPRYGEDGSVEVVLSHTEPERGGAISGLAIPEGGAWIAVLFHAPKEEVIGLEYKLPGFRLVDCRRRWRVLAHAAPLETGWEE